MKKVTELTAELAAPVIAAQGCELWDVEYVKEAGTWYLRLYIDKEGGVSIDDCEAISRRVSDLLDEADPIEGSYTFEVSSAGAERPLKRASDFARFLGSPVTVRLYKNRDGNTPFRKRRRCFGAVARRFLTKRTAFDKNLFCRVFCGRMV